MDLSSPAAVVPAPISPNSLIKRLKRDMEEAPLSVIDDETFSCMLNTFEKLVQMQYPSIQVVDSIKLICNILWSSIYIECPKQFLNENVLKEWMSLFLIVLEGPVPLEGQPADIECRSLRQWLKVCNKCQIIQQSFCQNI